VVIGDPGSGKTTLLKYYAVKCLDKANKRYKEFGFEQEVLPIYFPLREVEFDKDDQPVLLPDNLERWVKGYLLDIPAHRFREWLREEKTLVLLDGLDEISSKEQRRKVCRWIEKMCTGLENARFVVTSRATGFRKLDGIEFGIPHLRADIMDFSPQQQEVFLRKWFRAVFLSGLPPVDNDLPGPGWKEQQEKLADQRSKTIIDFLNREDNKAVRELAAVPMLLQIMAILWKKREYLPRTRTDLYDKSLNYLLEYRGQQKGIDPMLTAKESRCVLAPTALWMQEELERDDAPKEEMHLRMQPILNTLEGQPGAGEFCDYLRDRAGVIADYDKEHYGFRHKSFREYLSGLQL
jgi:predicted NACHT family NTPase